MGELHAMVLGGCAASAADDKATLSDDKGSEGDEKALKVDFV